MGVIFQEALGMRIKTASVATKLVAFVGNKSAITQHKSAKSKMMGWHDHLQSMTVKKSFMPQK